MRLLLCAALLIARSASAHEFWIEPADYTPNNNQRLIAEVRSGESFEGEAYPFMPERIVRAEIVNVTSRSQLTGRSGDRPAIQYNADEGIQILSYQSTASIHVHQQFSKFREFLEADGLQWVEAVHFERNLPQSGFSEKFTRYAKSLVSVGGVSGYDRQVGQPYEMVVLSRLYGEEDNHDFTIQLLSAGQPVNNAQVTVFQKAPTESMDNTPLKLRTNEFGKVSVPRGKGGAYLVSAVIMERGERVPWHSHWTSVTFHAQGSR